MKYEGLEKIIKLSGQKKVTIPEVGEFCFILDPIGDYVFSDVKHNYEIVRTGTFEDLIKRVEQYIKLEYSPSSVIIFRTHMENYHRTGHVEFLEEKNGIRGNELVSDLASIALAKKTYKTPHDKELIKLEVIEKVVKELEKVGIYARFYEKGKGNKI